MSALFSAAFALVVAVVATLISLVDAPEKSDPPEPSVIERIFGS